VIRNATRADLPAIVAIYNASIPGRMSTADTEPVSVESRVGWFEAHTRNKRPLWVLERGGDIIAWLSVHPFYGRSAYDATVELSIYVSPSAQGQGLGRTLLRTLLRRAPTFGIKVMLAFVFGHNAPSLRLFAREGFERWGTLPRVAVLDGIERDLVILGRRPPRKPARGRAATGS
jgi:phosphinothricin acetyltransferase